MRFHEETGRRPGTAVPTRTLLPAAALSTVAFACVAPNTPVSVAGSYAPASSFQQGGPARAGDAPAVANVPAPARASSSSYWSLGQDAAPGGAPVPSPFDGPPGSQARERSWFEGDFNTASQLTSLALLLGFGSVIAAGDTDDIEGVGDVLQLALPATAFAGTYVADDGVGFLQFTKSWALDTAFVAIMKDIAEKWRPNSAATGFASDQSFPSGHASSTWVGADFIMYRYGPRVGIPAYIAATYTGYSRIQANKHHTDDVLAGFSFATFFNRAFASPIDEDRTFALRPVALENGLGLQLSLVGSGDRRPETRVRTLPEFEPRFRYELEFGSVWQEKNLVQAPEGASQIDFTDNEGASNPTTSAQGQFSWYIAPEHELDIMWWPFEARDITGPIATDLTLGDTTIPAGTELRTLYFHSDFASRWRYSLTDPGGPWRFKLGAGLSLQFTEVEIQDLAQSDDVPGSGTAERLFIALPIAHAHLGYAFTDKWLVFAEFDGMSFPQDDYLNGRAELRYQLTQHWDLGAGYRYYMRNTRHSDFRNDLVAHRGVLSIGYSF